MIKPARYHYNIISAFIKSMRGSDATAALYYMARMLQAGEDPKFVARRMVIFASEDIGLAAPAALNLAVSTFYGGGAHRHAGVPIQFIPLRRRAGQSPKIAPSRRCYEPAHWLPPENIRTCPYPYTSATPQQN